MARSRHVYLVTGTDSNFPMAGFTVKRELVAWLRKKRNAPGDPLRFMHVYRLHDGGYPSGAVTLPIDELLASDG